eukprot:tig00001021_g6304.t1
MRVLPAERAWQQANGFYPADDDADSYDPHGDLAGAEEREAPAPPPMTFSESPRVPSRGRVLHSPQPPERQERASEPARRAGPSASTSSQSLRRSPEESPYAQPLLPPDLLPARASFSRQSTSAGGPRSAADENGARLNAAKAARKAAEEMAHRMAVRIAFLRREAERAEKDLASTVQKTEEIRRVAQERARAKAEKEERRAEGPRSSSSAAGGRLSTSPAQDPAPPAAPRPPRPNPRAGSFRAPRAPS